MLGFDYRLTLLWFGGWLAMRSCLQIVVLDGFGLFDFGWFCLLCFC